VRGEREGWGCEPVFSGVGVGGWGWDGGVERVRARAGRATGCALCTCVCVSFCLFVPRFLFVFSIPSTRPRSFFTPLISPQAEKRATHRVRLAMGGASPARPPTAGGASTTGEPPTTPAAGVVLVLIDGVGDVGGPSGAPGSDGGGGGGRGERATTLPPGATPLQAAATPVLDAIAGACVCVLVPAAALKACVDGVQAATKKKRQRPLARRLSTRTHAFFPHPQTPPATGVLGLLDPVEPGRACGSDTAHLSLLGYDPRT
jgi:hypothetical protein